MVTVQDSPPDHPVWLSDTEQPKGAVVSDGLCVSGQAGNPAGLHAAFRCAHRTGGILQCHRCTGTVITITLLLTKEMM